jgi:hypothetical protein
MKKNVRFHKWTAPVITSLLATATVDTCNAYKLDTGKQDTDLLRMGCGGFCRQTAAQQWGGQEPGGQSRQDVSMIWRWRMTWQQGQMLSRIMISED